MPSAFSWPMSVPSALRAPAPVNQGVRLQMAVEGIISILEVAVNAVAAVFQLALHTLAAGLGPWRYLLSTSYRTSVNSRYQGSSRFKKLIAFTWGGVRLIASFSIVCGVAYFGYRLYTYSPPQPKTNKERMLEVLSDKASMAVSKSISPTSQ